MNAAWRWIQYGFGVLILLGMLCGIVLASGSAVELRQLHAARSWQGRPAVITHAYVRHKRAFRGRYWDAEIAGRYVDDGVTFGVSRRAYGIQNGLNTRAKAVALTEQFPVGATIEAFHEPGRPHRAILDNAPDATPSWITLGVGIGLFGLPFALSWLGRRRRGNRMDTAEHS